MSNYTENNNLAKVRDKSFDFIKGVLIFLVVYGHVIVAVEPNFNNDIVFAGIYSFHMPLFVFISGYFAMHALQKTFIDCVKKVWYRLLTPALIWSLVAFCVSFLNGTGRGMMSVVVESLRSVWFLYCIALLYIVGCLVFKTGKWRYFVALFLALGAYSFYNVPGVVYIEYFQPIRQWPLFVMGLAYYDYKTKLTPSVSRSIVIASVIVYVGLMTWLSSKFPLEYIRSHENYILRAIIYQTGAISWFVVMCWTYKLIRKTYIASFVTRLGRDTLGVYAMNSKGIMLLKWIVPISILTMTPSWLTAMILTSMLFAFTLTLKSNKFTAKYLLGEKNEDSICHIDRHVRVSP